MANPIRGIVISQVSTDFKTTQPQMDLVNRQIRKVYPDHSMVWNVEHNPHGSGAHIHGWQRSNDLHVDVLRNAVYKAGFGWSGYERMERARGRPVKYSLKTVVDLPSHPEDEAWDILDGYLRLNGNRLVHNTRGFWRLPSGEPTDLRRAYRTWSRPWRMAQEACA